MTSSISTLVAQPPMVIVNFGWYYSSGQRLAEKTYQEGGTNYPPGMTTLGGVSPITLPVSTIPSAFGSLSALQAAFETSGSIVINSFSGSRATVQYTGLAMASGLPSFTGCTGGTGTFQVGTAIYDPRFYVDQAPLGVVVTFDATDHLNLGLPTVASPPGVTVLNYEWDLGNGTTGFGPFVSTTYNYNIPPPNLQVTLTTIDSLGRTASCAQRINLILKNPIWGTALRERQSNLAYR